MLEALIYLLLRQGRRYDQCQTCKNKWTAHPSGTALEIGPEVIQCKCGISYRTQLREWTHFTDREKKSYFLWTAESQFILLFGTACILLAYFTFGTAAAMTTSEWVIIIASSLLGIGWFFRARAVRKSLIRQPHENPMFNPGSMPWEW